MKGGQSREHRSGLEEVSDGLQPGMGLTGVMSSKIGPGRRKASETGAEQASMSRRPSTILSPSSKRGRGLASQSSQLGLAQIPRSKSEDIDEDEDEDEITDAALAMQLNNYGGGAQIPESDKSRSTSISVSIEVPAQPKLQHSQTRLQETSSSSSSVINSTHAPSQFQSRIRQATPSSSKSKTKTPIKPHASTTHNPTTTKPSSSISKTPITTNPKFPFSEPSSSSRKTTPIKLAKPTNTPFSKPSSSSTKPKTLQTKLKSFFLPNQTLKTSSSERLTRKRTPTPITQPDDEEEDEDEAWNVERILDDETRIIREDGKKQTYYLIKWEGDYEDTWEPSENVAVELKKEYKKVKHMMKAAKQKKRKRENEDCEDRSTERKRRTTTSRSRSPLFMNDEDEDMDEEQDEIAVLPSTERRQTKSPLVLFGTKSESKFRSKSNSRSVSLLGEQYDEGDTTMYDARSVTPLEERGLFISRTPPKQKAQPIDLRSFSEPEYEHDNRPEDLKNVGGKAGVINISSDEESA